MPRTPCFEMLNAVLRTTQGGTRASRLAPIVILGIRVLVPSLQRRALHRRNGAARLLTLAGTRRG
jgi:hypothetical protein